MKNWKKSLAAILVSLNVLGQLFLATPAVTKAQDDESTRIDATITPGDKNPDRTPKTTYWTGETMNVYSTVDVSGINVNLVNPYSIVTIPREHLQLGANENPSYQGKNTYSIGGFTFSAAASIKDYQVYADADNVYVRYNYEQLKGGMRIDIPLSMRFNNNTTPNGTQKTITNTLYREDGSVYTSSSTTLTGKATSKYRATKHTLNPYYEVKNWRTGVYGDENDFSKTRPDGANNVPEVGYRIWVSPVTEDGGSKPNGVGDYLPKKIKIIDRLPEKAVYKGSNYLSFTYDPALHAAVYEGPFRLNYNGRVLADIVLRYPGVPMDTVYTNNVEVIIDEGEENEQSGEGFRDASNVEFFFVPTPTPRGRQYHHDAHKWPDDGNHNTILAKPEDHKSAPDPARHTMGFTMRFRNTGIAGDFPTEMKEFIDFALDRDHPDLGGNNLRDNLEIMDYTSFKLTSIPVSEAEFNNGATPNKLIGVTLDDQEVVLATNINLNQVVEIPRTPRLKSVLLRFDDVLIIQPGRQIQADVKALPTDEGWQTQHERFVSNKWFGNWTRSKVRRQGETDFAYTGADSGYGAYKKPDTGLQLASIRHTPEQVRIFDRVQVEALNFMHGTFIAETNYEAKNVKTLVLLPEGIEYVAAPKEEGDTKFGSVFYDNSHNPTVPATPVEPTIIKNWQNTGRTALVYDFGKVGTPTGRNGWEWNWNHRAAGVKVWTEVTKFAREGQNTFDFYTYWSNNTGMTKARAWNTSNYIDALDIDNDGNKDEIFLRHDQRVNYIPPRELLVKKQVSHDKRAWLLSAPAGDLDTEFWYRFEVKNQSLANYTKFFLLDEFPALGDKTIVENQYGEYPKRLSDFPVFLAEAVTPPEGYTAYYSLEAQTETSTTRDAVNATWLTADQVDDFSKVRRLKIELNPGAVLASESQVNFDFKMRLPKDTSLENFTQFANNSVAFSTNGVNYLEANTVSIPIVKYEVEGIVFHDLAKEGELNGGDKGRAGYTVKLFKSDGTPATDLDGNPYETTTDAKGYYHFDVYKRGDYYVQFEKKPADNWTADRPADVKRGNDAVNVIDPEMRKTNVFKLEPNNRKAIRDAGVYDATANLVIRKVETGTTKGLEGAVFVLKKDGAEFQRGTTDANGYVSFTELEAGRYSYKEVKAPKGYVFVDRPEVELNLGEGDYVENLNFENDIITGDLQIIKKDQHDEKVFVEGATFELRQTDEEGDDVVIARGTTDNQGRLTFSNVRYGRYKLVETVSPANYVLDGTEREVEITGDGLTAPEPVVVNVTNVLKTATVTVVKQDAEDAEVKLAGVKLALKKGDATVREAITNRDGLATFERVPLGEYTLVEVETIEGYFLDENISVPVTVAEENVGETIAVEPALTNRKIRGHVVVTKKDGDTQAVLENVEFALKKGEVEVATATTNAQGVARFENVVYGDYSLVEKQGLEGYRTATDVAVQVRNDGAEHSYTVNNYKMRANVTLTKVDVDDTSVKLPGVEFVLKQDDVVKYRATTDSEGVATFANVLYGTYKLVESATLENYVLDSTEREVQVTSDEAVSVGQLTNRKKKSTVTVLKVDAEDSATTLPGVTFVLKQGKVEKYRAVTDSTGLATFENVIYGDYDLSEVETLTNYNLSTQVVPVRVTQDGATVEVGQFTNAIKKGTVELTKRDVDTNEVLQGVTYELRKGQTVVATQVTNNAGKVRFESVPYGDYTLVETATLENYVLDATPIEVQVREQGELVEKAATNVKKKADVVLKKVDGDDTTVNLQGVTFVLKQGTVEKYSATTDAEGVARFENVIYGDYKLVEKSTLVNYNLLTSSTDVQVRENGVEVNVGTIENFKKKGHVTLTKLDVDTQEVIPGVVFELKQGNEVIQTQTTDNKGQLRFENVVYGDYTVVEKTPLVNYVANEQAIAVEVREHNKVYDLGTISNRKIKGTVTLTKVDVDDTSVQLQGVIFVLKQNGVEKYRAVTNAQGVASFENVIYGDYKLVEFQTLENYVLDETERDVEIRVDAETVNVGQLTNRKKKAPVTVVKVDEDQPTTKLAGVTFILRQDGKEKYRAVSDDQGLVRFENVIYGDYELVEVETLINYNLSTRVVPVQVREDGVLVEVGLFHNPIKKGTVTLIKRDVDTNEPLAGVTYELREGDTVVRTAQTNAEGKVSFANVIYGDYTLVETATLENYVLDATPIEVQVREQGVEVLKNATNVKKKADVRLEKVSAHDAEQKLEGVTFILEQAGVEKYRGTTNEQGVLVFPSVIYGDYELVEVSTLKEFNLLMARTIVEVRENGVEVNLGQIENLPITGSIELTKRDAETNEVLEGVTYELRLKKADGTTERLAEQVTNAQGKVLFEGLYYGDYELVEVGTLENYVLDETPIPASIREEGKIIELEATNLKKRGKVIVTKADFDQQNLFLQGVSFVLSQDGEVKYEAITDEQGVATFEGVIYGDYELSEKAPLEGYKASEQLLGVAMREQDSVLDMGLWLNEKMKGSIQVFKKHATSKEGLAGVSFELRRLEKGQKIAVQVGLTDEQGFLSFNGLPYGDYELEETKAKDGFYRDETLRRFEIRKDGQVLAAEVLNEPIPLPVPKTGETSSMGVLAILSFVLALGLVGIKRRQ